MASIEARGYTNPVFGRDFPDPFVLKYLGEYWAYCTGLRDDGMAFGVLHSTDLVHWSELGGAMRPLADGPPYYWAPEVTHDDGRFLLYYSAGNETLMHLRVAVASHPAGPFVDAGRRLTSEEFAIDAHVFEDADGERYMFYATDFLQHAHVGTGTVVDRMLDPFTLVGRPRPVTRAKYDWQVYDPQRAEKGGVRWHTVEGPFVLSRKGTLYEMFSGGNWKNVTYGVSYATSDRVETDDEWEQACDGERVLPILRTVPGAVVGPGHNSVVRGPDNRQLYCVYHEWALDGSGRVLAVDPLDWAGRRMTVLGPSHTPSPAPSRPTVEGVDLGSWTLDGGSWGADGGVARQAADEGEARASLALTSSQLLAEVSLRIDGRGGAAGVELAGADGPIVRLEVETAPARATLRWREGASWEARDLPAREGFDPKIFRLLRLDCDGRRLRVALEGARASEVWLAAPPSDLALVTRDAAAAFAGLAITRGWEDLFEEGGPADLGWEAMGGEWTVADGRLSFAGGGEGAIFKGSPLESYELVVNCRAADGGAGVYPAVGADGPGPRVSLARDGGGWALVSEPGGAMALPPSFDPSVDQQFRFRKENGRVAIRWESAALGEIAAPAGPTRVGLYTRAAASFEMVRVTEIA